MVENLIEICKILGLVALILFTSLVIIALIENAIKNLFARNRNKKKLEELDGKLVELIKEIAENNARAEAEFKKDNEEKPKKRKYTKRKTKKDSE